MIYSWSLIINTKCEEQNAPNSTNRVRVSESFYYVIAIKRDHRRDFRKNQYRPLRPGTSIAPVIRTRFVTAVERRTVTAIGNAGAEAPPHYRPRLTRANNPRLFETQIMEPCIAALSNLRTEAVVNERVLRFFRVSCRRAEIKIDSLLVQRFVIKFATPIILSADV